MPTINLQAYAPYGTTLYLDNQNYWVEGYYAGTGDFAIYAGNGNNTYITGAWAVSFTAGDGNNRIVSGGVYSSFYLGDGHNNVWLSGDGHTARLGNGGNIIKLDGTYHDVRSGDGVDLVTVGGYGSSVSTGGGDDSITVRGVDVQIDAGAGNDRVLLVTSEGFQAGVIKTGAGDDIIRYQSGGAFIDGGTGNDTIYFATPSEVWDERAGAVVTFNRPGDGVDELIGDVMVQGNGFDLHNALSATDWNGDVATLGNYLHVEASGRSTTISVLKSGDTPDHFTGIAIIRQVVSYDNFVHHSYF
jgi:Ca2+-binding RTX toxin-like protein